MNQKESWEKEIREVMDSDAPDDSPYLNVLSIIRTLLLNQRQEGYKEGQEDEAIAHQKEDLDVRQETLREVERIIKGKKIAWIQGVSDKEEQRIKNIVNNILQDLLSRLKEMEKR